jgi:hypothetical protein
MGTRAWLVAGVYVGTVTAVAACAFAGPDQGFSGLEAAALLLTLPAMVVGLPVVYVLGAAAWNLTDADAAGPMWPVTVVYAATFATVAVVNVGLLRFVATRLRSRRPAVTLTRSP